MKKYKVKLTSEHCSYLEIMIEGILSRNPLLPIVDYDLLALAGISEVLTVIKRAQSEYKREYKISFTPVQAFSIVWLYEVLQSNDYSNHFVNRLLQINNEILQKYSV